MKPILSLLGLLTLFLTSGCIVAEGGHRGHRHYESRAAIVVPAPIVIVPAVRVRVD